MKKTFSKRAFEYFYDALSRKLGRENSYTKPHHKQRWKNNYSDFLFLYFFFEGKKLFPSFLCVIWWAFKVLENFVQLHCVPVSIIHSFVMWKIVKMFDKRGSDHCVWEAWFKKKIQWNYWNSFFTSQNFLIKTKANLCWKNVSGKNSSESSLYFQFLFNSRILTYERNFSGNNTHWFVFIYA